MTLTVEYDVPDELVASVPMPRAPLDSQPDDDTPAHDAVPDYRRRLQHVAELSALACGALAAISTMVTARFGSGQLAVHIIPLVCWTFLTALAAVAMRAALTEDTQHKDNQRRVLQLTLLAAQLVAVTGAVASAGGAAGTFWLLFLPAVMVAAASFDVLASTAVGAMASLGTYVGSVIAHTAHGSDAGRLVVILPLFPVAAWAAGALSSGARQAALDAHELRQSLDRDVAELSKLLAAVAKGDLRSVPSVSGGTGDAGAAALAVGFADTLLALRRLVRRIADVGEEIAGNAAEVVRAAEDHAAGVAEQTAAVAETTATIEQLASTAAQIANTAGRVTRCAAQSLTDTVTAQETVDASLAAMDTIAHRVDAITERGQRLRALIDDIGGLLDGIDMLSTQTNMLALSAAIETARAGEHGRGFRQVADEVRRLAERAQHATSDVRAIVAGIAAEVAATVSAGEAGRIDVRRGHDLTRNVNRALTQISRHVEDTTTAAQEITVATKEQRAASDAVVAAMVQVAGTGGRYRAGSMRYVEAAGGLSRVAETFRDTVRRFRLA